MKKFAALVCEIAHETINTVCNFILIRMAVEAIFGDSDN